MVLVVPTFSFNDYVCYRLSERRRDSNPLHITALPQSYTRKGVSSSAEYAESCPWGAELVMSHVYEKKIKRKLKEG